MMHDMMGLYFGFLRQTVMVHLGSEGWREERERVKTVPGIPELWVPALLLPIAVGGQRRCQLSRRTRSSTDISYCYHRHHFLG